MTADASSDSSTDGLFLSSGVVLPDVQQQQLQESDGFPALGNFSLTAASSSAHLNEVVPGLWIGDIVAATDASLLAERGVRQVVSVLRGSVELPADVTAHVIAVDDDDLADLLTHLPRAVDFIRTAVAGGGVLVHCQAGMSRSATIVAAYLMVSLKLPVNEALDKIRQVRPCIQPSETFMAQLRLYEAAGYRVSAEDKATRVFYRERMMNDMISGRRIGSSGSLLARLPTSTTTAGPSGSTVYRNRRLRCAKCRRELALREHVLHLSASLDPDVAPTPSEVPDAVPADRTSSSSDLLAGMSKEATITAGHQQTTIFTPPPILDPKSTCSGYFIEPMGWMDPLFDGSVAGKLLCPNQRCKAKIGNFDWAGQKCGCKAWITPGFCLTRAKVDDISY